VRNRRDRQFALRHADDRHWSFSIPAISAMAINILAASTSIQERSIYGSFFRTVLHFGGAAVTPQFSTTNHTVERAFQANWTHTLTPQL